MSKLVFDADGQRYFETGVKNCVLYTKTAVGGGYANGVAWNGITAISESPEGAEPNAIYADNIKYLNLLSVEEFKASIEAYTYPEAFGPCDGVGTDATTPGLYVTQQDRKQFGLVYRTEIGNDETQEKGFKLHIIYNCLAAPSEKSYQTINDSPEAITFSWEISTTPTAVTGYKPTSHLEIDSTKVASATMTTLLDNLYGKDGTGSPATGEIQPHLLTPDEIITMLTTNGGGVVAG